MILIYITIYLIGSILAYGRMNASLCYSNNSILKRVLGQNIKVGYKGLLLSWIGFIISIIIYFQDKEKYFLKFKNWN